MLHTNTDLFSRVPFFLSALFADHPFPPFSRHLFAPFSPLKSALFCRATGTAQSLERGSSRMDLSPKFGKEIPSRNLRKKKVRLLQALNTEFQEELVGTFASPASSCSCCGFSAMLLLPYCCICSIGWTQKDCSFQCVTCANLQGSGVFLQFLMFVLLAMSCGCCIGQQCN